MYYYVNLVFKLVICFINNKLRLEKRMGKYSRMIWTGQQYRTFMLMILLQKEIPADFLRLLKINGNWSESDSTQIFGRFFNE